MSAWSLDRLRRACLQIACGVALATGIDIVVASAAPRLEDFDTTTWAQWQRELPRPAIVVFSTTYCPTCPEVFADLARSVKQAGKTVPLVAVIMDADGLPRLSHLEHFRHADHFFVFRGNEAALRFSVNPQWRGVTPYVALFGPQGAPTLTSGRPSAAQMRVVLDRQ